MQLLGNTGRIGPFREGALLEGGEDKGNMAAARGLAAGTAAVAETGEAASVAPASCRFSISLYLAMSPRLNAML